MTLDDARARFEALYVHVEGYALSHSDRRRRADDRSLIYGEITFEGLYALLLACEPRPGETFFDLGCGTGKALVAAALQFPFARCVGVELLPGLCEAARRVLHEAKLPRIELIEGDLFDIELHTPGIVFVHATCFEPELMERLAEKLETAPTGTRIILVSQLMPGGRFEHLGQRSCQMEWGETFAHLYRAG